MSQVAATMGYTVDQLSDSTSEASQNMAKLEAFAQEMGATTAFSASQAADALNYMALAGYDVDTSMETLPSVLNLAAAGGIDLASASDMVTDALSALGKGSDYAETMVDQMALTSSKSNTSVAQLGEAILTVGGTAKMLAGGTTELNAALGILADNGTKGAEGGTKLRNILLSLGAPTDKAAEMLDTLGVSAYDSDGNMRPLKDTLADLNGAMANMTTAEKTDIINTIFNKADIKDVNALLATDVARWDELTTAIDGSKGAAENMANVQLDNLQGDITLFQSALEGVQIAISDGVTPNLREFVQLGTAGLGEIATKLQSGDITGAFDVLGDYIGKFIVRIADMAPQMIQAALTLLRSFGSAIMNNLDVILDAAIEIILAITDGLIGALPELARAAIQIIVRLAEGISAALPDLIPTIVDIILEVVDTLIDNADLLLDASLALILGLANGLINAVPKLIEKAPVIIGKLTESLISASPKLALAAVQLIGQLAIGLISAVPQLLMKIPQIVSDIVNAFKSKSGYFNDVGTNMVAGIWNGWADSWNRLVQNVKNAANNLIKSVQSAFKIQSPSKVFAEIGEYCVAGFDEGTEDMFGEIQADNFARNVEASISAQTAGQSNDVSVQSNVVLEGEAAGVFRLVRQETRKVSRSLGYNPLYT